MNICKVDAFVNDNGEIIQAIAASAAEVMLYIRMCNVFIKQCSSPEIINLFVAQKLNQKLIDILVRVVLS